MQTKSLVEAKIIEVRDVMSRFSGINIIIQISPTNLMIFHPDCIRKVKNRKRRTLDGIMRTAKRGCIITHQDNPEILNNPLYIIYLTEDDLIKMSREKWDTNKIVDKWNT